MKRAKSSKAKAPKRAPCPTDLEVWAYNATDVMAKVAGRVNHLTCALTSIFEHDDQSLINAVDYLEEGINHVLNNLEVARLKLAAEVNAALVARYESVGLKPPAAPKLGD